MIFNDFKELETKNGITTYRSLCNFDGGYFYLMKRLYSAAVNEWLGYWVRTNKFDNPALKHTTENTVIFNPPCAMLPSMTPAFGDYSGKSLDYILHKMDEFIDFKAIGNTASQYLEAGSGSLDVYFKFNSIKSVKINKPAVIIFWIDGTKTVAVAKDTEFDPYIGFYVAYAKKFDKTNLNRGIKMLEKEIDKGNKTSSESTDKRMTNYEKYKTDIIDIVSETSKKYYGLCAFKSEKVPGLDDCKEITCNACGRKFKEWLSQEAEHD